MNYRTKNTLLIIGFILALIICYKFAFSKTVDIRNEYITLMQQEELLKNTPKQLSLLKQKQHYYDSLLVKYQLKEGSLQNNLLKTINKFADSTNIKVIDFLEPHTIQKNNLEIRTYQFSLEGDYKNTIKLIYKLEQETKFGEIINLEFQRKNNFKTGHVFLQAKVVLKNLG